MRTLNVALGERSYPIRIGRDLLHQLGELLSNVPSRRAIVVTNPIVAGHHLEAVRAGLAAAGFRDDTIVVPDGEAHKDWATLHLVLTQLLQFRAERRTLLIALGGGVIGDLAGFAAAIYQRGMPYVQIPTTLLAQVDSSVGGKTAVNHALGKNMIGAFYQPLSVIIDTGTLRTLPERQFAAGIAEVIKYGAIRDIALFDWLETNAERMLARDPEALAHAIGESCRIKAAIVAADEREAGERALLNFGHTFAHAIETNAGYGAWLHGEAVAAGMVLACELSRRVTGLTATDAGRVRALIERSRLPAKAPSLDPGRYIDLMQRDKKVADGTIRFVLLKSLGKAIAGVSVPQAELRELLDRR